MAMSGCPGRLLTLDVTAMWGAYLHYRKGFLPVEGGILNQSATFCVATRLCESFHSMHEEIEMKRG